jgi:hypothetical protein
MQLMPTDKKIPRETEREAVSKRNSPKDMATHLRRPHHSTALEPGIRRHHGSGRPSVKANPSNPNQWRSNFRGGSMNLQGHGVEGLRSPRSSDQQPGITVYLQVHQGPIPSPGDKNEPIHCLSPTNRWPDRACQSGGRTVSAIVHQPPTG